MSTASTNSNSSLKTSLNGSYAVTRLQQEIAELKQEIQAIKGKDHDESTERNLPVRIAEPVENGKNGRTLSQMESTPVRRSPRPQLGKRSATCHTGKELGVKTGRKRRRSSSFSGPYLQRRSLNLGSLYSELPDPLLVLKAENRELQRKLQEAKISETGKMVKVLSENAQLHRKIVELNIKNVPRDEAEKVSRLVKENAELKKQLGEVSILNSAWCDVTPRLTRKQNEERKISRDLREVGAASCLRIKGLCQLGHMRSRVRLRLTCIQLVARFCVSAFWKSWINDFKVLLIIARMRLGLHSPFDFY